jgi:hypothetical protein
VAVLGRPSEPSEVAKDVVDAPPPALLAAARVVASASTRGAITRTAVSSCEKGVVYEVGSCWYRCTAVVANQ